MSSEAEELYLSRMEHAFVPAIKVEPPPEAKRPPPPSMSTRTKAEAAEEEEEESDGEGDSPTEAQVEEEGSGPHVHFEHAEAVATLKRDVARLKESHIKLSRARDKWEAGVGTSHAKGLFKLNQEVEKLREGQAKLVLSSHRWDQMQGALEGWVTQVKALQASMRQMESQVSADNKRFNARAAREQNMKPSPKQEETKPFFANLLSNILPHTPSKTSRTDDSASSSSSSEPSSRSRTASPTPSEKKKMDELPLTPVKKKSGGTPTRRSRTSTPTSEERKKMDERNAREREKRRLKKEQAADAATQSPTQEGRVTRSRAKASEAPPVQGRDMKDVALLLGGVYGARDDQKDGENEALPLTDEESIQGSLISPKAEEDDNEPPEPCEDQREGFHNMLLYVIRYLQSTQLETHEELDEVVGPIHVVATLNFPTMEKITSLSDRQATILRMVSCLYQTVLVISMEREVIPELVYGTDELLMEALHRVHAIL